jgi:dTDP-4-dehydrorhamnose 3,5-epimerase
MKPLLYYYNKGFFMEYPKLIRNQVFVDLRGTFAPLSLKYDNDLEPLLKKNWLQSNISVNPQMYTLRGLHFQVGEKAQSKLIKVITGSIIDFVVDIREDSPEYMRLYHYLMEPGDELIVPRGYAHGFLTTSFNTVVQYLVDNDYSPESEGSIYWKEVEGLYDLLDSYNPFYELSEDIIIMSDKDYITKNFTKNGK